MMLRGDATPNKQRHHRQRRRRHHRIREFIARFRRGACTGKTNFAVRPIGTHVRCMQSYSRPAASPPTPRPIPTPPTKPPTSDAQPTTNNSQQRTAMTTTTTTVLLNDVRKPSGGPHSLSLPLSLSGWLVAPQYTYMCLYAYIKYTKQVAHSRATRASTDRVGCKSIRRMNDVRSD